MQWDQIKPCLSDHQPSGSEHVFAHHLATALLVGVVIPLGLLRNGLRILVISLLCVHIGPEMINSPIHRRGGPIFFVASLIPLFVMLWWLRQREVAAQQQRAPENPKSIPADVPIA